MKMKRMTAMLCAGMLACSGAVTLPAAYAVHAEETIPVINGMKYEIGGVDAVTAPRCIEAGADVLVAGSAVFGKADRAAAIAGIRGIG